MSHEANVRKSYRLTSQIAMIVAIFDRIRKGKSIIDPDRIAVALGNFLRMLNGVKAFGDGGARAGCGADPAGRPRAERSTFAARVIASTLSDMHSAIVGAIGALKGPLHGGANAETMKLLFAIDEAEADPVEYVAQICWRRRRRSPASATACTLPKTRGRPTCGRCRRTWARPPASRSGSTCRARLSCL